MSLALSPTVAALLSIAAEDGPFAESRREPTGRPATPGLLARIAAGLAFAADWRRRSDAVARLSRLPASELAERGFDRDAVARQVYWVEFAAAAGQTAPAELPRNRRNSRH